MEEPRARAQRMATEEAEERALAIKRQGEEAAARAAAEAKAEEEAKAVEEAEAKQAEAAAKEVEESAAAKEAEESAAVKAAFEARLSAEVKAIDEAAAAKTAGEAAAAGVKGQAVSGGGGGGILAELKGLDRFSTFCAALEVAGIDLSSGEYTVLAPSDSAFDTYKREGGGPITEDVLKYHIIPGRKSLDSLTSDQPTLQGGTLTYERKLRKNWLDGAIIGLMPASDWPVDVGCGNGVIHTIDTVLIPNAVAAAEAEAAAREEERLAGAEEARRAWLDKRDAP